MKNGWFYEENKEQQLEFISNTSYIAYLLGRQENTLELKLEWFPNDTAKFPLSFKVEYVHVSR